MQFDKDSKEVKDNETRQVTTLSSPSIPINRHHPICTDPKKLDGLLNRFIGKEFGIVPDSFRLILV